MNFYPQSLTELINALARLPGVGKKSALRFAYHLLHCSDGEVKRLLGAITNVRTKIGHCQDCFCLSETPICSICSDQRRDHRMVCVVESSQNMFALEGSGTFKGLYHVLGGLISPLDGVGPEHLRVAELLRRVKGQNITEVILALSSNVEGEATTTYLKSQLAETQVTLTRIASGIPVGGELEYADEITLARSLAGRQKL